MQTKKEMEAIKALSKKTEDTGWVNSTLLNDWGEHSSNNQNPPQYRKKGGVVYLHGCVMAVAGTNTSNRNIAQLQQGFRPSGTVNNLYFTVRTTSSGESILSHIQITVSGIIMAPSGLKQGDWFALDGISFPA